MSRVGRRFLMRLGLKSGEPETARRFQIIAVLGLGKSSTAVAEELVVARSTVVRTAHRFAEEGADGLYDKRHHNGKPKANDGFRLVAVMP